MSKSIKLFAVALLILSTSCATIIHGRNQDLSISSNPSAASVTIDGLEVGKTPLTTRLSRRDHHTVKIALDGYLAYETKFTRKVDGWIAGNIVFGGLIGLAVDAVSGGMYKLTPDQIQADMKTGTSSVQKSNDGLYFAVVMKADENWQKIGQLTKVGK